MTQYTIGIDVGSTNTDAVIVDEKNNVVHAVKVPTTSDVTTGLIQALNKVVEEAGVNREEIKRVTYGTTHGLNAIIERKGLYKVGVIRIGLPATTSIEPMTDWPQDLVEAIGKNIIMVEGGHEYNGEEISPLDEQKIRKAAKEFKDKKIQSIAITSVFSPVIPEHENRAAEIIREEMGEETPISLSHTIGSIGLLERENATILNSAIIGVIRKSIKAVREAMEKLNIQHAQLYLAQNDGTILSAEEAQKYPIFTVVAAVSNSVRGAYVLTGLENAIVIDTGGTTSNIGVLEKGFPRESSTAAIIGGVRTSFMMPDFISIGLAGGSIVKVKEGKITVGPESVGYRINPEAIVFGGNTTTATDIAIALGLATIDDPKADNERPKKVIDPELARKAHEYIKEKIEDQIDRIKTKPDPMPVVLVGGGSIILPRQLKGASKVIRPRAAQSANAIGAATALVGATIEKAYSYEQVPREKAIEETKEEARKRAIEMGARAETVEIVMVEEISMPYFPGTTVKIKVKAAGKAIQ